MRTAMTRRLSFDRVAHVYDATRGMPAVLLDGIVEQIASAFERGRVLDAGVGTGRYAVPLEARGLQVVGIDLSRKMMDRAQQRGASRLVQGDLAHIPFRDDAFVHAFGIHVLHLLPDWREALREVARVTRTYFATIVEIKDKRATAYQETVRKLGYRYEPPGIDPNQLAELVKPAIRFPRLTQRWAMSAETVLEQFATKSYTWQWDIPDQIHEQAMEKLRRDIGGRQFDNTWTIELLVWHAGDLRDI